MHWTAKHLGLLAVAALVGQAATAARPAEPYIELVDRLDRPHDGYCIDIAGSGPWIDVTVPVSAHNCKRGTPQPDQAVVHDAGTGRVRFPALGVCLTALGRASRSLANMPLMVRPCAEDVDLRRHPFVAPGLQSFVHRADGRLELSGSALCVTVGRDTSTTFSPHDSWRALYLDHCARADPKLSVWHRPPRR